MFKKYVICLLIILVCFSCLTSAFADTIIYRDSGPVIVVFNPNGSIQETIWPNANDYYTYEDTKPVETNNNNNDDNDTTNNNEAVNPEVPKEISNDLAKQIFNLTNEERKKAGLNELTYNFDLQESADLRAKESSVLFDHTRPNGETCYTVFNIDYNVAGENLIKADKPIATAENLMASWMESKGHRENILLPEFTSLSVGIYEANGMIYASQLFIG